MLSALDQLRLGREGESLPSQGTLGIAQVLMVEAFSDFAKVSGDYRWVASKVTASTSKVQTPLGFAIKV
ncbi:MAG TPA: hypothetical protein V6D26_13640 [Stenomitos sp.]